jgi:hypothetical protein
LAARFAFEARDAIGIAGDAGGEDLDGDITIQLAIARPIHLAHSARAERGQDVVRPEAVAGTESHSVVRL